MAADFSRGLRPRLMAGRMFRCPRRTRPAAANRSWTTLMAIPTFTMRQLLEAGVHFGHQTRRWNPRMAPFLFGVRNGVHIIDLTQTMPMLHRALEATRDVAAAGGRILFVGTKRQAQEPIPRGARRAAQ